MLGCKSQNGANQSLTRPLVSIWRDSLHIINISITLNLFVEQAEVTDLQITSLSRECTQVSLVLHTESAIKASSKNKAITQRTNNHVIYNTQ